MTEQRHSPGPWSFDGPPDNIHVRLANDPNMRVCFMTSDGPTEANARLIAAAPDLLATLKALVFYFTDDGQSCGRPELEVFRNARAAIAKAEGTKR